MQKAKAMKI